MTKWSKKASIATNTSIFGLSAVIGVTISLLLHFKKINNFLSIPLSGLGLPILYGVIAGLAVLLIGKIMEFGVRILTFDKTLGKAEELTKTFNAERWHFYMNAFGLNGDVICGPDGKQIEDGWINVLNYMYSGAQEKLTTPWIHKDAYNQEWSVDTGDKYFRPVKENQTLHLKGYTIQRKLAANEQPSTKTILSNAFTQTISCGFAKTA